MTREQEIQARLDLATPGPWRLDDGHAHGQEGCRCMSCWDPTTAWLTWNKVFCDDNPNGRPDCSVAGYSFEDAALIANAPDDLRYLLAENARLGEVLKYVAHGCKCSGVSRAIEILRGRDE